MKKQISILSLFLLLFIFSSCQRDNQVQGIEEITPDYFASAEGLVRDFYYSKTFCGGTGFHQKDDQAPWYYYTGEPLEIDYRIDNGGDSFECGISIILDGVFQKFLLTDKNEKHVGEAVWHSIHLKKGETRFLRLKFNPNIGKKGDIMNIAIGTMIEPSFYNEYTGYGSYSRYDQHDLTASSDVVVYMLVDAKTQQEGTVLKSDYISIPNIYKTWFVSDDPDLPENSRTRWGREYKAKLFTDFSMVENGVSLIQTQRKKAAEIFFDVFGMKADWRASLFINHELVDLSNGQSFFDFSTNEQSLTRVTLVVNTSELPKNNHAYVVLFQKAENTNDNPIGNYVFADRIGTYYFIVEETDEIN